MTTSPAARKIQLTFLTRSLDYGGAQRQLITLAKALDQNKFDISILTFYSGQPLERELDESGVRVISLDKKGRWDLFSFARKLIRETKNLQPDVLHSYLDLPNILALWLKRFVPARVVWGVRASAIDLKNYDWLFRLAARTEQMLSRYPDLIIVNSVAAREYQLARGFPPNKLTLIRNGIDTDVFKSDEKARVKLRAEWNISESTQLVGTVGRLDPIKDLPVFLHAASLVKHKLTDVRFACIGPGPAAYLEELKALGRTLGLAKSLIWPGARSDMADVYNALDLLVSCSRGESFPNTIAEAMACGVPCVVTDVGDSAFVVGDCGRVVSPQNVEGLAAEICALLATHGDVHTRRGRVRILENFGVKQLVKLTEEAILSAVTPQPANNSTKGR